jgi:hypothetical protein
VADDKIIGIESMYAEHERRSAAAQEVEKEKHKVRVLFGMLRAGHTLPKIILDPEFRDAKWDWRWVTDTLCRFIDWGKVRAFMSGNRKVA